MTVVAEDLHGPSSILEWHGCLCHNLVHVAPLFLPTVIQLGAHRIGAWPRPYREIDHGCVAQGTPRAPRSQQSLLAVGVPAPTVSVPRQTLGLNGRRGAAHIACPHFRMLAVLSESIRKSWQTGQLTASELSMHLWLSFICNNEVLN